MSISRSWRGLFTIGPRRRPDPSAIADRISAGIASARLRMGAHESLDELTEDGDYRAHQRAERAAIRAFAAAREAALLVAKDPNPRFADPVLTAAMRMFPAPAGADHHEHAQGIIDLHRGWRTIQSIEPPRRKQWSRRGSLGPQRPRIPRSRRRSKPRCTICTNYGSPTLAGGSMARARAAAPA
jgi:hypothetical protein